MTDSKLKAKEWIERQIGRGLWIAHGSDVHPMAESLSMLIDAHAAEAVKAATEKLKWCGVVPGEKGCGDRCMECLRDRADYEAAMTTRECEARERAEKERNVSLERDQLKAEVEKLTEEKEQSEGQCETVSRAYIREQEQGASLRKRVEELEADNERLLMSAGTRLKIMEYVHFVLAGTNEVEGDLGNSVQLAADRVAERIEQARREGVKAERQRMASTAGGLGAELLDEARREGAEEMRKWAAGEIDRQAENFAIDAGISHVLKTLARIVRALDPPKEKRPQHSSECEPNDEGGMDCVCGVQVGVDPPKAQESERVTIPVIRADGVGAITLTMEEFGEVQARVYHRDLRACQHTSVATSRCLAQSTRRVSRKAEGGGAAAGEADHVASACSTCITKAAGLPVPGYPHDPGCRLALQEEKAERGGA